MYDITKPDLFSAFGLSEEEVTKFITETVVPHKRWPDALSAVLLDEKIELRYKLIMMYVFGCEAGETKVRSEIEALAQLDERSTVH